MLRQKLKNTTKAVSRDRLSIDEISLMILRDKTPPSTNISTESAQCLLMADRSYILFLSL